MNCLCNLFDGNNCALWIIIIALILLCGTGNNGCGCGCN